MARLELTFAANHPTAGGHFPGNPIIPGALLLAEVLHSIATENGCMVQAGQVKIAKFLHPVRPGDTVIIECTRSASGTIQFECAVAEHKVLTGSVDA